MSNWLQYIEGSSLFIDALFSRSTYARCCPATKNPRQIEQRQSAMETLETLLKKNSDMKNQDDTSYYETIPSVEDGNIQQTDADSSQETDKHRCSLVDVVYYKLLRPLTKYTLTLFVVEGITPFFLEGASGIKELLGEEPKYLGLLVPMVFTLGSLVFKAAYNTFEALLKKVDELVESLVNCRNEFSLPAEFWYAPITYSISLSVTLGLSCFSFYGMVGLLLANIDLLSDFADFIKIDESFLYNLTFYAAHFAPVIFNFFFFIDKVLRLFSHLARSGKFGETAKESAINREYLKQLMQLVNISNPETLEKIEFSEHNLGSDIESLPKMENNIADGLKVERNGIFNCCSPSNEVEHQPLLGNNGAPATYSAV